jgi:acetylornithine/N-succinyldiaminopimelate aminotransferase
MVDGFLYLDAGDIDGFRNYAKNGDVCAIIMEAVQGEGGVLPLEKEFVKGVKEICDKENILLIMDEVQTGNGRTGTLYAYEQYGITPDIVSTAKGLGGGLPLGATLFYDKTEKVLTAGLHGSTFGGNPVATAGALSIVNRLDDEFLSEVKKKSEYIFNQLVGAEGIISVSGLGFMIGIETTGDASKIIKKCMERGVLPIKAKNKVRLLPPLNIPWNLLKKGVEIIKQCAKEEK